VCKTTAFCKQLLRNTATSHTVVVVCVRHRDTRGARLFIKSPSAITT
jgi:hypothetical protein